MKTFKKFVEEKKINEAVDQKVVIHTKNGKVDYIEQGTFMPNGVFIGNAGVNFDRGFIGMDPEDAKASLIKYAKFSPEKIIIEDSKVVLHTKNGIVDYVEKDKQIEGPYDAEFLKNYNVNKGVIGMKPDEAKASLIKSGYKPEQIIVEDNSWTTADGSKIEVKQDKVFMTTKDGKKFWMPRWEWEHAFDDDGDIENGPATWKIPNWRPMK